MLKKNLSQPVEKPKNIAPFQSQKISFEVGLNPPKNGTALSQADPCVSLANLDQYKASEENAIKVARALVEEGITIHHVGPYSISASCPEEKFETFFKTRLTTVEKPKDPSLPKDIVPQHQAEQAPPEKTKIKAPRAKNLKKLIDQIYVQQGPTFFSGEPSIPPHWKDKSRLRLPGDIAQLLKASSVHRSGITGKGVTVAVVDTGFYRHPYFIEQGYNFLAVTAPDAIDPSTDESSHGTGICATLLAVAPDINFIGIKMNNPTLAVKTAVELKPDIIVCGWGYDLDHRGSTLPNWLRPLQMAILEGVSQGITFCTASGNGQHAFPGNLPETISVGGVFVDETSNLFASSYASSFSSTWFPGRYVPDICGLCGERPDADYMVLPVQAESVLEKDQGWGAFSGTSSAAAQVAGVCALLKQAKPELTPESLKRNLEYTATDITATHTPYRTTAAPGWDLATGFGLVNAKSALDLIL